MLERDVQVGNEPIVCRHKEQEFFINPGWMKIQKAYPGNICFSEKLLQQNNEVCFFLQVKPIGKKILGYERKFFHPFCI